MAVGSRLSAWPARVLTIAGFALLLLGVEALLEWHARAAILPELPFLRYRINYDTAGAFVLSGVALIAFVGNARSAVAVCAVTVMLIGGARWLQHLVPALEIPTHPLLGNPWLPAAEYDDISPLTALGLVLSAGALLTLKRPPYSAARSVVAALVAFSTVALATFLMLASQSRGRFVYGWLQLDSNDAVNALGFILSGGAVLFFIFFGREPEARAARRWASLAVWLAVLIASLALWQALRLQQVRETLARTQFVAAAIKVELTTKLQDRVRVLQRVADRWESFPLSNGQVRVEMPRLLNDIPEFRAIAWADSGLIVRWVVPKGSYATGNSLFADPHRKAAAAAMMGSRGPAFTESMELKAGQRGFEVYVPVYREREFHGLLIGVVTHTGWLESLLADRFTEYSIALVEGGQPIGQVRLKDRARGIEWLNEQALPVYNVTWTLQVAPTEETLDAAATILPQITLITGFLLATLLAVTVFLFQVTLRRVRDAADANRQLALDIEARKQAEWALRQSEHENRRVVEKARDFYFRLFSDFPNLVWRTDASGSCDYCNQAWLDYTGRTLEQELGDGWMEGLHADDRGAWSEAFQQALRDKKPFEFQYRLRRGNGQYGWIICTCRPYHDMRGDLAGFLGACYDDTARRLMQAELRTSRERMRSFSWHLQTAREEEKTRIARELHDELGSTLTALRMDSSWLSRRIPPDDGAVAKKSQGIVRLADSAIQFIRKIITELRPSILDNLGLIAALRWQAKEFQERTGIVVTVHADQEEIAVDKARALVFFRIFQETLTNVLKHAHAKHVTVRFIATADSHALEVTDDGVGMAENSALKETTHGILGMQERAREFSGDFAISSAPGNGTTIRVSLPRAAQAPATAAIL
jgi:PAS domain S-box-containing protein